MNQEGLCVFNGNDAGASEFFSRCQIKKLRTGFYEDDESVYTSAKNIKIGNGGAEFDLCFAGKKPFTVSTALLGRHNIENILLAAALARYLGLSSEEIKQGIEKLEPVEHRLKLIRNQRGINIIDDSFNASVSGTQAALDVLAKFESNKIIITPGLIELGDIEKHENFKFGQNIAAVADFVILVGPIRTVPIKAGLMKGNFPEEKIIIAESRADAVAKLKNIMKPGDTVLFENDLPDNYSDR